MIKSRNFIFSDKRYTLLKVFFSELVPSCCSSQKYIFFIKRVKICSYFFLATALEPVPEVFFRTENLKFKSFISCCIGNNFDILVYAVDTSFNKNKSLFSRRLGAKGYVENFLISMWALICLQKFYIVIFLFYRRKL